MRVTAIVSILVLALLTGCAVRNRAGQGMGEQATTSSSHSTPQAPQTLPSTTATATEVESVGTTVPNWAEIDREFAEGWNRALRDEGPVETLFHSEMLAIYGADTCRDWLKSRGPIETVSYGWPQEHFDKSPRLVEFDDKQVILWATEMIAAPAENGNVNLTMDLPPKVVEDCGTPIPNSFPISLARINQKVRTPYGPNYPPYFRIDTFDAPARWFLEIEPSVEPCRVQVVADGETVLDYTGYESRAGVVETGGHIRLDVGEGCAWVNAYSTKRYLSHTEIMPLEPTPASVWIPVLSYAGTDPEVHAEFLLVVNSGETPADLTGWSLKDDDGTVVYEFPSGFTVGPVSPVRVRSDCGEDSKTELFVCDSDETIWEVAYTRPDPPTLTLEDAAGKRIDGMFYGTRE